MCIVAITSNDVKLMNTSHLMTSCWRITAYLCRRFGVTFARSWAQARVTTSLSWCSTRAPVCLHRKSPVPSPTAPYAHFNIRICTRCEHTSNMHIQTRCVVKAYHTLVSAYRYLFSNWAYARVISYTLSFCFPIFLNLILIFLSLAMCRWCRLRKRQSMRRAIWPCCAFWSSITILYVCTAHTQAHINKQTHAHTKVHENKRIHIHRSQFSNNRGGIIYDPPPTYTREQAHAHTLNRLVLFNL